MPSAPVKPQQRLPTPALILPGQVLLRVTEGGWLPWKGECLEGSQRGLGVGGEADDPGALEASMFLKLAPRTAVSLASDPTPRETIPARGEQ